MRNGSDTPYEQSCAELERKVEAHNQIAEIDQWLADARRSVLKEGPPRSQCPGCFSSIYDGAARQGWCCDCMPKRSRYEKDAYGY